MAFRVFRLLVGAVLAAIVAWLVGAGVGALAPSAGRLASGALLMPVVKIVAAIVIIGIYYYALWADSSIHRSLENIFSIPELLRKLAFTLALLCIYRVGFHVPLPGLDQQRVADMMTRQTTQKGIFGQAIQYYGIFTGGDLRKATLFGLGIMPYISASIIFQLLTSVVPALEKLRKEGPAGQKKIQEYTRYATVLLCVIQATFWMKLMMRVDAKTGSSLVYQEYVGSVRVFIMGVLGLTAGTIFMMWLGEQIDEYGIGNGISLIIMAGIVSRLPFAIIELVRLSTLSLAGAATESKIGPLKILFLIAAFVFVVAGAILITQGQRRIPIQQAKQMRGRRVYGGQRQYLPLRVNHGGVMPIIFASSLLIFPSVLFGYLASVGFVQSNATAAQIIYTLRESFRMGSFTYSIVYVGMIFFFAYFWTTVNFRPKDMAEQLRDYGSFIPGLRPGKRTADYLERVMERITYCGAAFLAVIAVIPMVISERVGIPFRISAFLGGTALLIIVSVTLDLVQRIEANLVMRNYGGFLGGSSRIKGAYR